MKISIRLFLITAILLLFIPSWHCNVPRHIVLAGSCEGCEGIFEFGGHKLSPTDTLPDFNETGTKIKITGTIYEKDGKTPARDVILYFYHTNQQGEYLNKYDRTGWAEEHGYIRSWLKTDSTGSYTIYTLKPGLYPSGVHPAHIHFVILQPDDTYYMVEDYFFEGDPLLSAEQQEPSSPMGGTSGVLHLTKQGDLLVGRRDIILEKNIPGMKSGIHMISVIIALVLLSTIIPVFTNRLKKD